MGDTTNIETVDAPAGVEIVMRTDAIARCPVDGSVDHYDVKLRVVSAGQSVECESLQRYLDTFSDVKVSQETLTARLDDAIGDALPDAMYHVETTGEHEGVSVDVRGR